MNKIAKFISTVAISTVAALLISTTAHASNTRCECGSEKLSTISETFWLTNYANPDYHFNVFIVEYFCLECGDFFEREEGVFEAHDYCLDTSSNMLICSGCGDSYSVFH